MTMTLSGDGTITGLIAGGLPNATVTTADIADAAITAAKLDGAQSGSAPIYGARAWVNFDGTGTPAIRASGNISSITDNGTGDYTVNFTTAMPDANYAVSGGCGNDNNDDRIISPTFFNSAPTTSGFRTRMTNNTGAAQDVSRITFQIIR
jgi:hypothetical protein